MNKGLQALGRLPVGKMNRTEQAYANLLEARKQDGEVVRYGFDGFNFRLADNTFYKPDFWVQFADGSVEIHEVKGAKAVFADDAKVKIKVAAAQYPFKFIACFPKDRRRGVIQTWEYVEY